MAGDPPSRSRAVLPTLDAVVARGQTSFSHRVDRLRSKSWQIGQCAVAAGLAWFVAKDLVGHQQPFFAPIVALVSLGTSYGQRWRRILEVSVGVAIGVFLGDMYTLFLGRGPWQITVMVGVAMVLALLLDASPLLVNQVAIQSLVVVTVLPPGGNAAFLRWTDALVGGGVALLAAAVVPRAPLRRPRLRAAAVVDRIGRLLRAAATAIDDHDVEEALELLRSARATDSLMADLRGAAAEGLSVLASSPFHPRQRGPVRQMADLVEPLDFALRNTRVLVRRVAVAAYKGEAVPPDYAQLLRELADCTDVVAEEMRSGRLATAARPLLVAAGVRTVSVGRAPELSAEVVLAQMRSLIADLLSVTGLDPLEATDQVPRLP